MAMHDQPDSRELRDFSYGNWAAARRRAELMPPVQSFATEECSELVRGLTGRFGKKRLERLTHLCVIGKWAEMDRDWVPLSREFPNLKGVTDETIKERVFGRYWCDKGPSMGWKYKERKPGKTGGGADYTTPAPSGDCPWAKAYLRSVKVLDRQDVTAMSMDLGEKLAEQIWDSMTPKEKEDTEGRFTRGALSSVISKATGGPMSGAEGWRDVTWDKLTELVKNEPVEDVGARDPYYFDDYASTPAEAVEARNLYLQKLKAGVLGAHGNIYVTTPKGGHEVLSIFAYANKGLHKVHIPSRIFDSPKIKTSKEQQEYLKARAKGLGYAVYRLSGGDSDTPEGKRHRDRLRETMLERVRQGESFEALVLQEDNPMLLDIKEERMKAAKLAGKIGEDLDESIKDEISGIPRGKRSGNWLDDTGHRVKRVILLDDIIASGQQAREAITNIRNEFPPGTPIFAGALAARRTAIQNVHEFTGLMGKQAMARIDAFPLSDQGLARKALMPADDEAELWRVGPHIVYSMGVQDIWNWEKCMSQREEWTEKAPSCLPPSVAFPWSTPDGTADKLLVDLYEGRAQRTGRKLPDEDDNDEEEASIIADRQIDELFAADEYDTGAMLGIE